MTEQKKDRNQITMWLDRKECIRLQKRWGLDYDKFMIDPNFENKKIIISTINDILVKHDRSLILADIGTGAGHFAYTFRNNVSKLICLDYSPEMLKLTKEKFDEINYKNIEYINGSCWDIPLKDNSVDFSISIDVVMHCGGSWACLKELIRISKKYALLTGPSFENFTDQMDKQLKKMSWAVSVPLLNKELDKMIQNKQIKSYEYKDRPRSQTYNHKILLIEK